MIGGLHWYPQPEPGQCWAAIGPRGKLLTVRRATTAADEETGVFECWLGALLVERGRSPCDAMGKLAKIATARARREALV